MFGQNYYGGWNQGCGGWNQGCGGYEHGGRGNSGSTFVLIVVLFILLIIVGSSFV